MTTHAIPPLVALTSEPGLIDPADLAATAAALQKQVVRDFAPAWGVSATVAAVPDPTKVPPGYWPIVVQKQIDEPGALGYHTDSRHQPYALVEHTPDWPCTASHELLEMLCDPWGSRLVACTHPTAGRVRVLVEVCDPCEAMTYPVDGVALSDFVMPHYYGPHRWRYANARLPGMSHCGMPGAPLSLERGGYLSYVTPDGKWHQDTWFSGSAPQTRTLGELTGQGSPREQVDAATTESRGWIGAAAPSSGD